MALVSNDYPQHDIATPKLRVDWTVPIWGVLGLLIQAIAVVWLIAGMNAKISETAVRVDKLETHVSVIDNQSSSAAAALARIDERTRLMTEALSRKQ
jgi:hypothetical protein